MKQSRLITFLKSSDFAIWVAILSMIVQSFHSYTAFYNTSSIQNYWGIAQAVLFAIIIDSAILFYTVRGRRDIALGAAFVMVVLNAYYYWQFHGLNFNFAFGIFLSLIIPASVYFYSEEVGGDEVSGDEMKVALLRQKLKETEDKLREVNAVNKTLHDHKLAWQNEYIKEAANASKNGQDSPEDKSLIGLNR